MKNNITMILLFTMIYNIHGSQKSHQFLEEFSCDQIQDDTLIIWENGHNGWSTYAIAQTPEGKKYLLTDDEFDKYLKKMQTK